MEMVQFHPTGVLAGPGTRMTGTIIEEGLRGAGGYLLGGDGERFMHKYDSRGERATRDIVSRSMQREILAGNVNAEGGALDRDGASRPRARARANSRAWSNAAPTTASTWPAAACRWCRPRTT